MSKIEYIHQNLALHGRLVHDEMSDAERAKRNPGDRPAPAYEIGVVVEGVFVPLLRRRSAGGLFADIERAKDAKAEQREQPAPESPAPPAPAQPSQPTPPAQT